MSGYRMDMECRSVRSARSVWRKVFVFVFVFCFCISKSLTIKRMLATWLPCTVAFVPYGTHMSVFASSLTSTDVRSELVLGGATDQDSDISQRMSSPTPLSEPEIIAEIKVAGSQR